MIIIEYHGGGYSGFQRQDDVPTIQGEVEKAITKFCQQEIKITGAGRTDAGVHARGQVAHFDLDYPRGITGFELAKAINAHLVPQPISVVHAEEVREEFHARFGAKLKTYQYRIVNRPFKMAMDEGFAWWVKKPLNIEAMREGAKHLIGQHDFSTFRDSNCQANSPVRSVDEITIETSSIVNGYDILFTVKGKSFLHHQVRNIVGTLSLVGEGKWMSDDVKTALEAKDRTKGGPTAPAEGLYLESIDYK
jgi:tRNA pseudouridine38-40 synthase